MKKTPVITDTVENYSLELELQYVGTDPNHILGRGWRTKHSRFKKIKDDIFRLTLKTKPKLPLEKFKISIIRRYNGKSLDWDNLIASLKPAVDGLVMAGIIKNDSWKYIRHIAADQVKAKEGEREALLIKVEGE